ncbi:MAG: glycosyltransferase family 4 protein [Tissierellia bacterium]|nr:glycosyltransferase family 4 protein [Tissierellia bacterium]
MRIAMLTNNYKPFVGGVPISIERLANELRELGHEVYIFAPSYGSDEEDPYVIRYRSIKKKMKGVITVPYILDSTIEEKFSSLSFDLIHVHHPMLIGYVAQYLKLKYKVPIVFTYHTRYEQYLHYIRPYDVIQQHSNRVKNPIISLFEKKVVCRGIEKLVTFHNRIFSNHCQLVFAPSYSMKNFLEEQGTITDVKVVPTGIEEDDFKCDLNKVKDIRKKYLKDKDYIFCTVSRLGKEKNISFILKGLKIFKERKGDCFRFLIVGDGDQREELEKEVESLGIEDNVVFCGNIEHKEIRNYYHACDLFLFASQSETQGIVLLEAMAAGLPVVAVYGSGVCDVIENGVNGFMTHMDVNAWEEKIERIVENEPMRRQMERNAISKAEQYLSCNIAKTVVGYYRDLLFYISGEQVYEKKVI